MDDEFDELEGTDTIEGATDGARLQKIMDRNRNQNIMQRKNGRVSKKINPKNSKIAKKLGKKNSTNTKNGFANTLKNRFSFGKKKRDESANNNSSSESSSNSSSAEETLKKTIKVIKIAKIVGIIVLVLGAVFLALVIIVAIVSIVGKILSFFSPSKDNLDPSDDYYEAAVTYFDNLDKAKNEYLSSCGIIIDKNYLHATLAYSMLEQDDLDEKEMYKTMNQNIDNVTSLMVENCQVDYEKNGVFYNKLKNSVFFSNYYAVSLQENTKDEILDEIFDYAKDASDLERENISSVIIYPDLPVNVKSCDNQNSTMVSLYDYIKGVMYMELDNNITSSNMELLKTYATSITSHTLYTTGYNTQMDSITVYNGVCYQMYCDVNKGCTYIDKSLYTGFNSNGNASFTKGSISSEKNSVLDKVLDEVFGEVITDSKGTIQDISYSSNYVNSNCNDNCITKNSAIQDNNNGLTYSQIISKYTTNTSINNAKENSYVTNVTYNSGGNDDVVKYRQVDYSQTFCHIEGTNIRNYGCGVTSMAMILSTFVDRNLTPLVLNEEAYNTHTCSRSGTDASFFKIEAQKYGLGYLHVSKYGNLQTVINALKSGKSLVIVNVGPGTFIKAGGHYMVISKVNDKGEVYVIDPYRSSSKVDFKDGWYSFNDVVVKDSKSGFYIITKR